MGPITTLVLAVGGTIGALLFAILVRQGTDEFKAWTPHMTTKLLEVAVGMLPVEQRARMREEWGAHVGETPGEIGKWVEATGFLLSARRTVKAGLVIQTEQHQYTEHVIPKALLDSHDIDLVVTIEANVTRVVALQAKTFLSGSFSAGHLPRSRSTDN